MYIRYGMVILTNAETIPSWYLSKLKMVGPTYLKQSAVLPKFDELQIAYQEFQYETEAKSDSLTSVL